MKKFASTGLMLAAMLFGAVSCNQKEGAVEEAQETNEQKFEDTAVEETKDDVSEFMTKAASGGMMEVQLGQLAQENAASQEVKDFGKMMVDDHTKANEELKALAAQKNITLPDSMGQEQMDHVQELQGKTGAEFDQAYMSLMVEDHQEDIDLFKEAAQDLEDPDVKAFASKTVPVLQHHLERAQAVNDVVDNNQ
ncbi:DUF4142 domain-containing protein [Pontibacter sp. 172403-2]|uniref:DUF4142 domain-containing protein n=1 Tax=Pontibacter rufus TaxID=2791028 RepID=UPI0018AFDB41|nr:DUF4142 domain-containing protein [Pontibacter sp. 172403-2]MBF9255533.1 DUF4142 domain-containing protein [Pontibacter sp. 172403-2]